MASNNKKISILDVMISNPVSKKAKECRGKTVCIPIQEDKLDISNQGKLIDILPDEEEPFLIELGSDKVRVRCIIPVSSCYVPFKNLKEFLKEYKRHPNPEWFPDGLYALKLNSNDIEYSIVTSFGTDSIVVCGGERTWEDVYEFYTFCDGMPCGKRITDE